MYLFKLLNLQFFAEKPKEEKPKETPPEDKTEEKEDNANETIKLIEGLKEEVVKLREDNKALADSIEGLKSAQEKLGNTYKEVFTRKPESKPNSDEEVKEKDIFSHIMSVKDY